VSDYLQPIFIALFVFAFIAVMIFIPWLFYIYRRFGYFPVSTMFVFFSFLFYILAAFFLTLLPLPETRHNCTGLVREAAYSLTPFQFVEDILRESRVDWSRPSTYSFLLQERAFLQAFFNMLLLMPLGVYLRYYFGTRRAWWKAALIIGGVTLFFEVTQLTGIYGIYDCPYRLFDVDDLMLNGFGGLVGFFLAPIVLSLFPSRERVLAKAAQLAARDEVRNMVVLLATSIDLILIHVSVRVLGALSGYTDEWSKFIILTALMIVCLFFLPAIAHGQTFGTRIMRYRYTGDRWIEKLLKRTLALWLPYALQFAAYVIGEVAIPADAPLGAYLWFGVLSLGISVLLGLTLIVHIVVVLFSREKRRFYFDAYADLTTTRKLKL